MFLTILFKEKKWTEAQKIKVIDLINIGHFDLLTNSLRPAPPLKANPSFEIWEIQAMPVHAQKC